MSDAYICREAGCRFASGDTITSSKICLACGQMSAKIGKFVAVDMTPRNTLTTSSEYGALGRR